MSLAAAWEQQELPSGQVCAFTPAKPILGPDKIANNFDMGIGILWDTLLTKQSKKKHVPHLPCQIYVKRKAIGPLANGQNFT